MKPIDEAEKIASGLAGHPVSIRFVDEPKLVTGFSPRVNVVGSLFVYLLSRARGIPAAHGGTLQYKDAPPEWEAGITVLAQAGVLVPGPACRGWASWQMPDSQWRNAFEQWSAEHQEDLSEHWESWAYDGIKQRVIRLRA